MTTQRRPRILVGCDGSVESRAATEWADAYARATKGALTLVSTWQWPTFQEVPITFGRSGPDDSCRAMLARLRTSLDLPALRVSTEVHRGEAAHVLTGLSGEADLLVVGSHGLGMLSRLVLGSVSAYVAAHAKCPVAVVRDGGATLDGRGVVVGFDDSPSAREALRWAMDYADQVHRAVRVVHVAQPPVPPVPGGYPPLFAYPREEVHRELKRWLQDVVEKEQADRGREVEAGIGVAVLEGNPAGVMVDQSELATITVCGRRGAGGFHRLLLGSVASALAHHGHSTLVVTPPA